MPNNIKNKQALLIIIGIIFLIGCFVFLKKFVFDTRIDLKTEVKTGNINVVLLGKGGANHEGPDLTDTIIVATIIVSVRSGPSWLAPPFPRRTTLIFPVFTSVLRSILVSKTNFFKNTKHPIKKMIPIIINSACLFLMLLGIVYYGKKLGNG